MPFDIGFLGGGQLARMSIQAAQRLGFTCISIDSEPDSPASQVAPGLLGRLDDPEALAQLVRQCGWVLLENEFVPVAALREALALTGRPERVVAPNIQALEVVQDKLLQRERLQEAGVPCPRAAALDGDGTAAVAQVGYPMVLKVRFGGYDGRGTRYAKTPEDFEDSSIVWKSGGWMAEQYVDFRRELAVMVFRTPREAGCFPTVETVQTGHVCDLVYPADVDASEIALAAVEAIGGYGLFGVELFETRDGRILVNEIAPRPHNSGHYTLDWGGPSQFDQYIRVGLGLPLAPLDGIPTAMANLLGQPDARDWRLGLYAALVHDPGVRVHWYGKARTRPGRKMGHINATGPYGRGRVVAAREKFYEGWTGRAPFVPGVPERTVPLADD